MSIKKQDNISLMLKLSIQNDISKSDKSLKSIKKILDPLRVKNTYYMIKKDLG